MPIFTFPTSDVSLDAETTLPDPPVILTLDRPPLPPEQDPFYDPEYFNLTVIPDAVVLTTDALAKTPKGLRGLDGNDYVRGVESAEFLNGNGGSDCLLGRGGNDTLRGGKDFDVLAGGTGDDVLGGNDGDDFLFGNDGNDILRGGQGNDALIGGLGADFLVGDRGIDRLWGGAGVDVFVLTRETAAPRQNIGTALPATGEPQFSLQNLPADIILDYNPQEDIIGLNAGLTPANLVLSERYITIGDARDYDTAGPYPLGLVRTEEFRFLQTKVTVIAEAGSGAILGLVKDVAPASLKFGSVPDASLLVG